MIKNTLLTISALMCIATASAGQKSGKADRTVRIMSYNIRNCRGMDNRTDPDRIVEAILTTAPDAIAVQEVDSMTQRSGRKYILGELAELTGMHATYSPSINFDGGKYGIGILSREKPLSYRCVALPGREEARSMLIAEFDKYYLCCTHLSLTPGDQAASVEIIIKELKSLDSRKPVYFAGDLNTTPETGVTARLLEEFDMLSDPSQPTIPAGKPKDTIDYIYRLKNGRKPKTAGYRVMGEYVGSDHVPIVVDVKR